MTYELSPLLLPFALATVSVFLPWYLVDTFSDDRFRIALAVFSLSLAMWSLGVMGRLSATTVAAERLWHNVRFAGPAFSSVGYFVFAAVYTNHDAWVQRRRLWLLFIIPTLTTVLVWTNPQHMLVRAAVEPSNSEPLVMAYTPGAWFVVHAVYSYALVVVGTGWIASRFLGFQADSYFPKQTLSVLVSVGVIMAAAVAHNLGLTAIEWTPVGGGLWGIIFTIAVSEYRMFDLSPLARDVVVENMESGMIVTNSGGEVVDCNHAATMRLSAAKDEIIGERLNDVFVAPITRIDEMLATESRTETVRVQRDGDRWYEITVSPISIPADDDVGRVIMFDDVTDRVERQQQLEAQKQSLERQNERLDEFASVVGHDLRNPLSTIDGWLSVTDSALTGDDVAVDEMEKALENIEQAHGRMDTIVDGLLRLARAGQVVEDTETVELAAVADDAWDHAAVDDCELDVTIPADTTVDADRDRLLQVFENLYRNAADHNQEAVTLRTGVVGTGDMSTDGGTEGGFYIEDNGRGIPDQITEDIFEHGYTTDSEGTGMGLSIVQDIVTAHGWDISITTGPDGGARFEITGVTIDR
ncbi:MAG: PAS sensor histidine kinase [Halonotius sp. J07HN4]|nr:MAG: PAS sensor histidine kinase [Halonotius sp. J07HN4]